MAGIFSWEWAQVASSPPKAGGGLPAVLRPPREAQTTLPPRCLSSEIL